MKYPERLTVFQDWRPQSWGADCGHCPLNDRTPIQPTLNLRAEAAAIGEAPGYNEELEQAFFVGESGQLLDKMLDALGEHRSVLHITNALLCKSDKVLSPAEWQQAIAACRPRLAYELALIKPRALILLGKRALVAVTGRAKIFDWMGAPLQGAIFLDGKPVKPERVPKLDKKTPTWRQGPTTVDLTGYIALPVLHPAFCLRSPAYTPVATTHIARGLALARGQLPAWRWPRVLVHPDKRMMTALKTILRTKPLIAYDVETAGKDPLHDELLCVGLATDKLMLSVPMRAFQGKHSSLEGPSLEILDLLTKILGDDQIHKLAHNGSFDKLSCEANGFVVRGYVGDTLLAGAVVAPDVSKKLSILACVEFHAERWKEVFRIGTDEPGANRFLNADPIDRAIYNARDCSITRLLWDRMLTRLKKHPSGMKLFNELMALQTIAIKMRRVGVLVDRERLARHRRALRRRLVAARRTLLKRAARHNMSHFNPNAHAQVAKLFVRKLKVQPIRFSDKTGESSFDAKVLQILLGSNRPTVREAAQELLTYRQYQKLLSTYVDGLPIAPDERVHPSWNVHGAKTGRWSSSGPNLMNQPDEMRDIYTASRGWWMVKVDYSQLELRVLGLLSGDSGLLLAYEKGLDVHQENAKLIYGTKSPTPEQRDLSKHAVYGMNYGGGLEGLYEKLKPLFPDLTLSGLSFLMQQWYKTHPQVARWQREQVRHAEKTDKIISPLSGRVHTLHGLVEATKCYNYPIQDGAAEVINPRMRALDKALHESGAGRLLMQVHDELVMEGPDPGLLFQLCKEHMECTLEMGGNKMKFPVDVSIGKNYAEVIKVTSPDNVAALVHFAEREGSIGKIVKLLAAWAAKGKKLGLVEAISAVSRLEAR
mgnify:CR=1 FL=1